MGWLLPATLNNPFCARISLCNTDLSMSVVFIGIALRRKQNQKKAKTGRLFWSVKMMPVIYFSPLNINWIIIRHFTQHTAISLLAKFKWRPYSTLARATQQTQRLNSEWHIGTDGRLDILDSSHVDVVIDDSRSGLKCIFDSMLSAGRLNRKEIDSFPFDFSNRIRQFDLNAEAN